MNDARPVLIRDLEFSDLWINERGEAYLSEAKSLTPIPNACGPDAWTLARVLDDTTEREFPLSYDDVIYRAARMDGRHGIWWVLRRQAQSVPPLAELGFSDALVKRLVELGRHDSARGLVLVFGDTNMGKTWTVSALFKAWLETHGGTGLTVEAPPELPLEGNHGERGFCIQTRIAESEIDVQVALSARCNPAYLLIGEIRFSKSARQTLDAALSGRIVAATMHASGIEQGLLRFVDLAAGGAEIRARSPGAAEKPVEIEDVRQQLSDSLRLVIFQHLLRRPALARPILRSEVLIVDADSSAIQSLIRQGQFRQLRTIIERQQKLVQGI